jgi:two-component system, response regulator PdtaR
VDEQPRPDPAAILVVDDEPLLRMVLVDAFEDDGYHVTEAASAAEALDVLKARPEIRVVITDIQMPGSMDGLRLARYIDDAYPPIALIVASGAVTPSATDLPGKAIFMQKPVDTRALLRLVGELVAAA